MIIKYIRFFAAYFLTLASAIALCAAEDDISAKIQNAESKLTGKNLGAFALSMYYQGFSPSILNDINKPGMHHHVGFDIPSDEDLKSKIEIRDAAKAFEFAHKYYNAQEYYKVTEAMAYEMANMANIYLQGIGTEKNVDKALEILRTPIPHPFRFYPGVNYEFDSFRLPTPLVAYLYHHGIGVEKDFAKRDALLNDDPLPDDDPLLDKDALELAWKNFYCGYLVPKDYELAIYCLERRNDFWAADELVKIYSGEYLPEHKDEKKADHWRPIAAKRRAEFVKSKQDEIGERIKHYETEVQRSMIPLFRNHAMKSYTLNQNHTFTIEIPNPYYNKEKAFDYFSMLEKSKRNDPLYFSKELKQKSLQKTIHRRYSEFSHFSDDIDRFLFEKQQFYEKLANENK